MPRPLPFLALALAVLSAGTPARAQEGWQGDSDWPFGVYRQQQPILSLTADGGGSVGAGAGTFGLRLEGDRVGLLARFGAAGTTSSPAYGLWSIEPTWALIARENLRLRVRAGVAGASHSYNRLGMVSFAVGSEVVLCVVGPFDLEGDVTYTPFPFTRLEASGALAMMAGPFSLRGGVRLVHYDDQGNETGEPQGVGFLGPFLGVGLHF